MEKILLIPLILSFCISLFFTPIWIARAKRAGLVGKDMNKISKEEVAEGGGVSVIMGFVLGVLVYICIKTFVIKSSSEVIEILAVLSSILIVSFVGFTDDVLGWKIGLNKKSRIVFFIFAAVPLMVINAGESTMMGINFGLFYPLLLIPLGIVATSAAFNILAGYNGLEASQGMLILSALAFVNWMIGNSWLSLITLIMVAGLAGFYLFNKYPAKVFPGDVLTYSVGALIGINAILGNIEKIAIFFFIPYILEVILKVRGSLKKESFAKVSEDGSLDVPYEKFYGVEHIAVWIGKKLSKNGKTNERDVVYIINAFQIIVIVIGLIVFKENIFL